jgi:hypothetical protein
LVEISDEGVVVALMVDRHGLGVDMRLQRLVGVAERRQLERRIGRRNRGLGEGRAGT